MRARGVLSIGVLLLLAACGTPPEEGGSAGDGSDFLACLVTNQSGIDDRSFNAAAWAGLQQVDGIQTKYVSSKSEADFTPNINSLVGQNCGIITTVGFPLSDATLAAAKANPGETFTIVDADPNPDPAQPVDNIKPLLFNTAEAAYLAGYLAAGMTQTGTVGTFGGAKLPSVTVFMDGFSQGVDRYNTDNGAAVRLLGWDRARQDGLFAGGFDSPTDGKNLARNLTQQGADIILPVAGGTGLGAAQAAKESGGTLSIVWVDTDGYESAPQYKEVFLTSVLKGISTAVATATTETAEGDFDNTPFVGKLANDGVGLAPYHDFAEQVPDELGRKVEELRQQIISGGVVVESANAPAG